MSEKKPKIVTIKEGFTAEQVSEESVSKVVKSAQIFDAVDTMATDFIPDETHIFKNKEFDLVFATMSDDEADKLTGKPGVEGVEDDIMVYALNEDEFELPQDMLGAEDDIFGYGLDAAMEIDGAMDAYDDFSDEDFGLVTPQDAASAAQTTSHVDMFDIDETGELQFMNESAMPQTDAAGIPRDKLVALVKCVIKCAIENFSGKTLDVPDEKIAELLNSFDMPGAQTTVQAIRDYITCGLKIIYAPQAWRYSTGANVRVAVVDTGITPRHPDLRVYGGASFVPGVRSWYDDQGHGTHVAGTIAATMNNRGVVGVAPNARLYAVKVLNSAGSGRMSWILNGLAWCYRYRMHVVNLSLGSGERTHNTRVYSAAYENAGRTLRRRGILAVAAAGNSGATRNPYVNNPARCPSFMAVSAVDCNRRRASFSSYGPQVEICAPGVQTWSTYPPNRYRQLSGTSMATPHVAGVAALVKARYPTATGDQIRVHLWRTAIDLGRPGRDWFFGYGQVNAYRAVR